MSELESGLGPTGGITAAFLARVQGESMTTVTMLETTIGTLGESMQQAQKNIQDLQDELVAFKLDESTRSAEKEELTKQQMKGIWDSVGGIVG